MKAEEAKTKVCPFIQGYSQKLDVDGIEIQYFNSNCICGCCMAWVWEYTLENGQSASDGYCARTKE